MTDDSPKFRYDPDPDLPGWMRWELADTGLFNAFLGPLSVRVDDGIARVRMVPQRCHANLNNTVHGGAMLGFIDVALFAGSRGLGIINSGGALTIDLSTQFIAGPAIGQPIEARVEVLRETGRLIFLRGLVVQGDMTAASFAATVRKPGQ